MRHEGAPARYSSFMKLPLCVRPSRGRDAAMDSIIRPILKSPADRRCPPEERPRKVITVAAVSVVAAAFAGSFYFRSRRNAKLTEKDAVLVTDFANTTGDPVFDGTLKKALAVDLQQSPFRNGVPEQKVQQTWKFMVRSPGIA